MARILLIEDDSLLLDALERLFLREGYEVDTASNGNAGLQKVQDNDYDVIITDLIMPYTEGFAIVRHIRRYQRNTDVRIVIYTSLDNELAEQAGYRSGADLYLRKPANAAHLLEKVRGLLEMPPA